jgi:hypothetical protein
VTAHIWHNGGLHTARSKRNHALRNAQCIKDGKCFASIASSGAQLESQARVVVRKCDSRQLVDQFVDTDIPLVLVIG